MHATGVTPMALASTVSLFKAAVVGSTIFGVSEGAIQGDRTRTLSLIYQLNGSSETRAAIPDALNGQMVMSDFMVR